MRKRIRQAGFLQGIGPLRAWTVYFDENSASPVGTRGHLARNMVAEVALGDGKVRNDFDGVSIFHRPIFNATWDENTRRFVNFTARGEDGFTLSPKEPNREVIYRCTPFWYRIELSGEGALRMVSVSDEPLDGYTLAPMFRDGKTPVYRPCFEAAIDYSDRVIHSRAGLIPYEASPHALQSVIKARSNSARMENMADWFSDYLLLLVEFATCNLQGVMQGVCGEVINLYNAANRGADFPDGLYSASDPGLAPGDEISLLADGGMGELAPYGTFTVEKVVYMEGAGFLIELKNLDKDSLFWETYAWACTYEKVKTGGALSVVTNASSGRARSSACSPIVWRGKENPWGNAQNLLQDAAVHLSEWGEMQFFHLGKDATPFFFSGEGSYLPCGERVPGFAEENSYIKGMALCASGKGLHPVSFADYSPDLYYATRVSRWHGYLDPEGMWTVVATGGSYHKRSATNHATMEFLGEGAPNNRYNTLGARLIFEEA